MNEINVKINQHCKDIWNDKEMLIRNTIMNFLNKTVRMFRYNNLPETMNQRDLERYIQVNGFTIVAKINDKIYNFFGGLGELPSVYYNPTKAIIANPYLNISKELKIYYPELDINECECVVIRNDDFMIGMLPLISKYSHLIVESELTLKRALINTRAQTIATGDNDTAINSLNQLFAQIENGTKFGCIETSPGAIFDGIKTYEFNRESHIKDIIESIQYLKGSLYHELGINSSFNMKREAINEAESTLNNDILKPFIDTMFYNRKIGVEQVNKMFGTNISVEFDSVWEENKLETELSIDNLSEENNASNYKENIDKGVNENESN